MKVISAITLDELTDVLMNLVEDDSIEFEYEVNENSATGYIEIYCKMFDTEFFIAPLGDGPFYEDLLLTAFFSAYLDPEVLCTEFNNRHKFASAVPSTIESDDGNDEDDCQIIEVEKLVLLQGGVTDKHLEATIKLWTGMLMVAEQLFEGTPAESE
jgi:hypothetical protein